MTKSEITRHCNAAKKKMKSKGWKSFIKCQTGYSKRLSETMYYGGIYKGDFTIYINKDRRTNQISYSPYVSNQAPHGGVCQTLSVADRPSITDPNKAFEAQKKLIGKQIRLLRSYLKSVK